MPLLAPPRWAAGHFAGQVSSPSPGCKPLGATAAPLLLCSRRAGGQSAHRTRVTARTARGHHVRFCPARRARRGVKVRRAVRGGPQTRHSGRVAAARGARPDPVWVWRPALSPQGAPASDPATRTRVHRFQKGSRKEGDAEPGPRAWGIPPADARSPPASRGPGPTRSGCRRHGGGTGAACPAAPARCADTGLGAGRGAREHEEEAAGGAQERL